MSCTNVDIHSALKKRKWSNNDVLLFLSIAAIVFFSRLPFLGAGYGSDPDAWRVANVARSLAITGEYSASRLPGYPVQEIFCSLLWKGGPLALNGATALLSAFAAAFFALSMKALGYKNYILASLALAFTPVIFISSTSSIDYPWALAFILGSLYFVIAQRPLVAGAFLGAAIGCRITSGAMLVPLCMLLIQQTRRQYTVGNILKFLLGTFLVGTAAFVPVFLKYGWGFFSFADAAYPSLFRVIYRATIGVWGVIGLLALLVAIVSLIFQPKISKRESEIATPVARSSPIVWIWTVAISICVLAYLRLPHESGYLVPIVPFVILLLGRFLSQRLFIFVCIALIFSAFISPIDSLGIQGGSIFADYSRRQERMQLTEQVLSFGDSLHEPTVVVAGNLKPEIDESLFLKSPGMVKYVGPLNASGTKAYLSKGIKVYYLPGVREDRLGRRGVDLQEYGARQLPINTKQRTTYTHQIAPF